MRVPLPPSKTPPVKVLIAMGLVPPPVEQGKYCRAHFSLFEDTDETNKMGGPPINQVLIGGRREGA